MIVTPTLTDTIPHMVIHTHIHVDVDVIMAVVITGHIIATDIVDVVVGGNLTGAHGQQCPCASFRHRITPHAAPDFLVWSEF